MELGAKFFKNSIFIIRPKSCKGEIQFNKEMHFDVLPTSLAESFAKKFMVFDIVVKRHRREIWVKILSRMIIVPIFQSLHSNRRRCCSP